MFFLAVLLGRFVARRRKETSRHSQLLVMKRLSILAALFASPVLLVVANLAPQPHLEAVFGELRALKAMQRGTTYTLPARGQELTGANDDFLRRRDADEIAASGLSCGCGDYALLFSARMEARGFETLLVDSAQISLRSLISNFSGHAVVAIRPKDNPAAPWWLVDSTARKVLSREWSPAAKSFVASGQTYWIGYCGPVADYPARSPQELKRFYARTLATVPPEILNREIPRFRFTIDPSFQSPSGTYLNPRIVQLALQQDALLSRYGITSEREIEILLVPGADDGGSLLSSVEGRWIARVGLQSACSPNLLNYFALQVSAAKKRPQL